jgi:hypothetical protein
LLQVTLSARRAAMACAKVSATTPMPLRILTVAMRTSAEFAHRTAYRRGNRCAPAVVRFWHLTDKPAPEMTRRGLLAGVGGMTFCFAFGTDGNAYAKDQSKASYRLKQVL